MSKYHSTAKMTTLFSMPTEGGVEVPMLCPCCGEKLGARHVFDNTQTHDGSSSLPIALVFIQCRSCQFGADIRIAEDRIAITWGSGER